MNCRIAQRRLLSLADATRVPASLRAHLIDCQTCQEWQRRVIQVDRHIPLLAVPPSSFAKARFLREIRTKPAVWRRAWDGVTQLSEQVRQRRGWQAAVGGLAAAAALLFAVTWNAGPRSDGLAEASRRNQPDPLLASLVQRSTALAGATQPGERTQLVGQIGGDLCDQTLTLARAANTRAPQEALAKLYGEVVVEEVKCAGQVPAGERLGLLVPLARRLEQNAADAGHLAQEVGSDRADQPLQMIAQAARKGKKELDALYGQRAELEALPLPIPRLMAAGLVFASADPGLPAAEQALRFQRNEKLIKTVVKGSLRLAVENDPVKRADVCKQIAQVFAEEIQQAASEHEGLRATELSGYFGAVLERGVAVNLQSAGEKIPLMSMQNKPLLEIGSEVDRIAQPVEQELRRETDPKNQTYLERALKLVREGQDQVSAALKGRQDAPSKKSEIHADPQKK